MHDFHPQEILFRLVWQPIFQTLFTQVILTCHQILMPRIKMMVKKLSGLPQWLSGKESACQFRRHGFDPWVRKILWRREWQPTPVFLPGKFHGQRSLAGYSPWGHKEPDTTEHSHIRILS